MVVVVVVDLDLFCDSDSFPCLRFFVLCSFGFWMVLGVS
jgi:hypothetical protein